MSRRTGSPPTVWAVAWEWLARPIHYKAVRALRIAAEHGDAERLATCLDPHVAVVVDSGETEHPTVRVVHGLDDATALLLHGMRPRPGLVISERAISGQAGLVMTSDHRTDAAITVDFTGRLVSMIWIRLRPQMQRHWNTV